MEQTLGLREQRLDTSGSTSRSSTRVYPPRVCPVALPSSISRYNTARAPLPTEHSAPCEGKVETPAALRERRHRRPRTAPRRREGPVKPRSGGSGRPLPLSRESRSHRPRNREGPSSELHTLIMDRPRSRPVPPSGECRPQPGNGDPPGHGGCGMPGPGRGTGRDPGGLSRRPTEGRRGPGQPSGTAGHPVTAAPPAKAVCAAESPAPAPLDGTALPAAAAP